MTPEEPVPIGSGHATGRLIPNFEGGGDFARADLETAVLLGRWDLGSGCNVFGYSFFPYRG